MVVKETQNTKDEVGMQRCEQKHSHRCEHNMNWPIPICELFRFQCNGKNI